VAPVSTSPSSRPNFYYQRCPSVFTTTRVSAGQLLAVDLSRKKRGKRKEKGTCGDVHGAKQLVVNVLGTSYYGATVRWLLSLMHRFALMAPRGTLGPLSFPSRWRKKTGVCWSDTWTEPTYVVTVDLRLVRRQWHMQFDKWDKIKLPFGTKGAANFNTARSVAVIKYVICPIIIYPIIIFLNELILWVLREM